MPTNRPDAESATVALVATRAGKAKTRVIVVGGGTAGVIVAAELSRESSFEVVLVEAGNDREREPSANLFEAMHDPASYWPDAQCLIDESSFGYKRGLGIGGSSAINGAICSLPDPVEFEAWATATGDSTWGPDAVQSAFQELGSGITTLDRADWGRADRALANAAHKWPGNSVNGLPLAIDETTRHRRTPGFRLLNEARVRPNLTVLTGCNVERLVVNAAADNSGAATVNGVRLDNGTELVADHTVLCAGVIGSPTILLRSRVGRPGVGKSFQNHVGVTITWDFGEPIQEKGPVSSVVAELGDAGDRIQFVSFNVFGHGGDTNFGGFIASPMRPTSARGHLTLDSSGQPQIEFRLSPDDRCALGRALRVAVQIGTGAVDAGDATEALIDEAGSLASSLTSATPDELEQWAITHLAPVYHAVGTCRMGRVDDANSIVDPNCSVIGVTGLSVIDASVFPTLPAVGPNLTVAMVALKASQKLTALLTNHASLRPEATTDRQDLTANV